MSAVDLFPHSIRVAALQRSISHFDENLGNPLVFGLIQCTFGRHKYVIILQIVLCTHKRLKHVFCCARISAETRNVLNNANHGQLGGMLTLQRFTFAQPNNFTLDAPLDVRIEKGLQRSFMDLPHILITIMMQC